MLSNIFSQHKLIRNYLYNILYQLLVIAAPIVTAPYLARVLGAEALGEYSYVSTIASIIGTVGLIGLYNYGVRQIAYAHNSKIDTDYVFWEIIAIRMAMLLPGLLAFFIVGAISHSALNFLMYSPWLIAMYLDVSWLCVGKEDMKPVVCKNAFAKIATIAGIFLLVRDRADIWKYLALIGASTFLANVSVWFIIKRYVGSPKARISTFPIRIKNAFWFFLPQVTSLIYLQVDKVMIRWITGPTQVAYYDQAEKIINIPLAFITVMSTVLMPRIAAELSDNHKREVSDLINIALHISLFFAIPMMLGIAGIACSFVPWYLGEEFLPVITGIYYICPIICFNSIAGVLGSQYLTASNQMRILTKAYAIAAVVNVAANTFLIPIAGFKGAAVATQLSSFISIAIQYYYVRKQIDITVSKFSLIKYTCTALMMMISVYMIGSFFGVGFATTLLQIAAGGAIYITVMLVTKEPLIAEAIKELRIKRKA